MRVGLGVLLLTGAMLVGCGRIGVDLRPLDGAADGPDAGGDAALPVRDAGVDAGPPPMDSGVDAGPDTGIDAGTCGDDVVQPPEECESGDPATGGVGCHEDCTYLWWDRTFSQRVLMTFDNSDQNDALDEFSVAVRLDPSRFNYAAARVDGRDVRFVDGDGSTVLPHEVELWGVGGNSLIWVQVPRVDGASNSDHIWLYYGRADAPDGETGASTWDGDYAAVYHLHLGLTDSASDPSDGSTGGAVHQPGQLAGAQSVAGMMNRIELGSPTKLDNLFAAGGTIEAWIHPSTWGDNDFGRIADKSGSVNAGSGWGFQLDDGDSDPMRSLRFERDFDMLLGEWETPTDSLALDRWQYVVVTYDERDVANDPSFYIDGSLQTTLVQDAPMGVPLDDAAESLWLGNFSVEMNRGFVGGLDEVRFSTVERSADWVAAQHLSMTDALITYGPRQALPSTLAEP